jgi:RpiB/LacA/LacB family sugar-phosphate isomerase
VKEIVTAEDVMAVPPGGELSASPGAVVTPWARELAATRGVRIHQGPVRASASVVAVGGDHGGFPLKEKIKGILARTGHRFLDLGTFSTEPVDYPDIALAVALKVSRGEARFGILVDGAGIGSAMAANKVPGVLAAVVVNEAAARNAREHNDANVMTLGAGYVDASKLPDIVAAFLSAECTEERHARRVAKIRAIERDR